MKFALARLQLAANLAGAALLLWLSAPWLTLGGVHPFESTRARTVLLLWLAVVLLAALAAREAWRSRRNARLLDQLQTGDASVSQVLAERFAAAMQLLKSGTVMEAVPVTGWRRWRLALFGGRQVYTLPWYLIIGAPGAGKTTALLHSGLRFPLAERLGAAPVAGIGGTRHCDWWFTDRAVFIDTAGRYTTQDSHASGDAREWRSFLHLLRRHRPVQPVNGVVVTVSVPDLLQGGVELEAQATAVDLRLQELRAELGLRFPVYLLVTKADLLAGFVEFFADFDAVQREQPWGVAFGLPAESSPAALPQDLSSQLSLLVQRITALTPLRLQQEPQPQRRAAIQHFAAQVEGLLPTLERFARRALARTGDAPRQTVRGIHLSSGTQEGNPIDRVLGELARNYGMATRTLARPDAGGKAYFLKTLLQRFVIAEAPLAGTNLERVRRRRRLVATGTSAVAVGLVLACLLGWRSYRSNLDYVDTVRERVEQLARQTGDQDASGDLDGGRIDALLPLYDVLGTLAASGGVDPTQPPPGFGFGLFQGPRLAQAADQTYHRVLDRTLAPLLAERLSQALDQTADPAARYEALRVGLMIVQPERMQRAEVRRWAAAAIAAPARDDTASVPTGEPGVRAPGEGERKEWLRHLDALLERNALLQAVRLDPAVVASARKALAGVPFVERVHQRLLRRAGERFPGQLRLDDVAGPSATLTFRSPDAELPAVLTRAAWLDAMTPSLDSTIRELAGEAAWVLEDHSAALQRMANDGTGTGEVAQQVAQRQARSAGAAWDRWLGSLAPVEGDGLMKLAADLAGPGSAARMLMQRVAVEFASVENSASGSELSRFYGAALPSRLVALGDYGRGPGTAAIDRMAPQLAASIQEGASAPRVDLVRDLRAEAARAPAPMRELWAGLADALGAQVMQPAGSPVADGMAALTQACRQLIDERFPFTPTAKRDMPFADFARLFGPDGLLDAHFRSHFATQVDTRSRPWKWSANDKPADSHAQTTLRSFEMAADIRSLFFAHGEPLPQLTLKLTPVGMDEQLLQFSMDVDGQLLRYENGPRRTRPLQWPRPAAAQRVLLRIFPTGPTGVDAEVHEGPWALLRVLQRDAWKRHGDRPAGVRLTVDGRSLDLEAATDSPVSIELLADLSTFRCPQ